MCCLRGWSVGPKFLLFIALNFSLALDSFAARDFRVELVEAAKARTKVHVVYTPDYVALDYPGGDVPEGTGVCTDVVIRAYRKLGIDLQVLVHEDMKQAFSHYPKHWGAKRPDRNIDHRRVPNLQVYFKRQGAALSVSREAGRYQPGDLVTWNLNPQGWLPHIGVVIDRKTPDGKRPLIVHNMGGGTVAEDILFRFPITGHYRFIPGITKR